MNAFCWHKGRQETGYEKMRLLASKWPLPFDVYVLRFKVGSEIPLHTDEVSHGEHHRLNIILKNAQEGGQFLCEKPIINAHRIKYFRPDMAAHQVSKVVAGTRYVLSIGWIRQAA